MERLKRKVERFWIPGSSQSSRRTVALFSVGRNGELSELRLSRSSGNELVDQAALEAIRQAVPFETLPNAYKGERIDIEFVFDVNVLGGVSIQ
ncbi:MAG: energy transducer TonB [Cyanobacteria bacterium J06639_1]